MNIVNIKKPQFILGFIFGVLVATIAAIFIFGRLTYASQVVQTKEVLRAISDEKIFPAKFSSRPPVLWKEITNKKVVALTFDDGPDPRYTPKILAILKKENVKASFFVVGKNVERFPQLARNEQQAGHLIGNHTWNHALLIKKSQRQIKANLKLTAEILKDNHIKMARFFRPPYGALSDKLFRAVASSGYQVVLWTDEMHELRFPSAQADARAVADDVEPGTIILAHDGRGRHFAELSALPYLIKLLKQRGYKFVRLDQMPVNVLTKTPPVLPPNS